VIEFVISVCVLLGIAIVAVFEYYRRIRLIQKEYEKARGVVEDIVVSFNRQLRLEAERLGQIAYKVEAVASKSDRATKVVEEALKKVQFLEAKVNMKAEDADKLVTMFGDVNKRLQDIVTSQEKLSARISGLEEQVTRLSVAPEMKVEAVIPIKKEKALASLTETELSVLEMLASEGPKTAPEIKNRINLSREHTARLMKKLYDGGYLERDSSKIPFKYKVKKEMENLLKKAETEAT
jgi:predicted transcriptional regulator